MESELQRHQRAQNAAALDNIMSELRHELNASITASDQRILAQHEASEQAARSLHQTEAQVAVLTERLSYFMRKRQNYALMCLDQLPVMRALARFCNLVRRDIQANHTAVPEGLQQQMDEYLQYFQAHERDATAAITTLLGPRASPLELDDCAFDRMFLQDVPSWTAFSQTLPRSTVDTPRAAGAPPAGVSLDDIRMHECVGDETETAALRIAMMDTVGEEDNIVPTAGPDCIASCSVVPDRATAVLDLVWRGKYSSSPEFVPAQAKSGGCSPGFIARKRKTKPTRSGIEGRLWMAKLGWPEAFDVHETGAQLLTRTSRTRRRSVIVAIREKIAADAYFLLGFSRFLVAKHRLARLPILNEFTRSNAGVVAIVEELNAGKPESEWTREAVFLLSRFETGYQDLVCLNECLLPASAAEARGQNESSDAKGDDAAAPRAYSTCTFEQAVTAHRFIPEMAVIEGRAVPVTGLMQVLATASLLADTDCLGGSFRNCGFVVQRDSRNLPLQIRIVKIDAGEAFNFDGDNNFLRQSFNSIARGPLSTRQDIQFGSSQQIVIQWACLSQYQRDCFLDTLAAGLTCLKNRATLSYLVTRNGQFDGCFLPGPSPFAEPHSSLLIDSWLQYLNVLQRPEVFGDLLASFDLRTADQGMNTVS